MAKSFSLPILIELQNSVYKPKDQVVEMMREIFFGHFSKIATVMLKKDIERSRKSFGGVEKVLPKNQHFFTTFNSKKSIFA